MRFVPVESQRRVGRPSTGVRAVRWGLRRRLADESWPGRSALASAVGEFMFEGDRPGFTSIGRLDHSHTARIRGLSQSALFGSFGLSYLACRGVRLLVLALRLLADGGHHRHGTPPRA